MLNQSEFPAATDDSGDNWKCEYTNHLYQAPVRTSLPAYQHSVFYRPMSFLVPNQDSQSTEEVTIMLTALTLN